MPSHNNCHDQSPTDPADTRRNEIANWITFVVSAMVSLYYLLGSVCARRGYATADYKTTLQANVLSAVMASLIAILVIYAEWPQAIQEGTLVVIALAQASALGWLDFKPGEESRLRDVLAVKLPDIAALGVSLYAVKDIQDKWLDDPSHQASGLGLSIGTPWLWAMILCIISESSMCLLYCLMKKSATRHLFNRIAIAVVLIVFIVAGVASGGLGSFYTWWGCYPFSVGLGSASVSVICATIFAALQIRCQYSAYSTYQPVAEAKPVEHADGSPATV